MPGRPEMASRWVRRPEGSTWGDFGPDDQLGRLNLLTPEKVREAVAEIHEGLSFCLSLPLDFPGETASHRKACRDVHPRLRRAIDRIYRKRRHRAVGLQICFHQDAPALRLRHRGAIGACRAEQPHSKADQRAVSHAAPLDREGAELRRKDPRMPAAIIRDNSVSPVRARRNDGISRDRVCEWHSCIYLDDARADSDPAISAVIRRTFRKLHNRVFYKCY